MLLFLRLLWRGEIELPVAFWAGAVLLNLVLIDRIGITLIGFTQSSFLLRFYTALVVLFNAFLLPGLWRSATYWQGPRVWSRLTKVLCIVLAVRVIYTFVSLWSASDPLAAGSPLS